MHNVGTLEESGDSLLGGYRYPRGWPDLSRGSEFQTRSGEIGSGNATA